MNKYIREGAKSFRESHRRYSNPYKHGSVQFNDFERGWFQALKKSPVIWQSSYSNTGRISKRKTVGPRQPIRKRNREARSEETYLMLATRAIQKLFGRPSYSPSEYGWRTRVYYARVETNEMPLWKIGVTSNNLKSRYCIADRRIIVEIMSWHYATREEAEAIEREILAEFSDSIYKGDPVLRSGGDSELFSRDVLNLDFGTDMNVVLADPSELQSG